MKRLALMSLVVLCLTTGGAQADPIPGTERNVLGWKLGAYDREGKFSHCAMSIGYNSGITLYFAIFDNFTWSIGWAHAAWNLTPGQQVSIALSVDGSAPYRLTAKALNKTLAVADLPATAGVFDQVRKGYRMQVDAQGNQYGFSLDGTYAALTELGACTRSFAQRSTPPAPLVPPTHQHASSSDQHKVSAEERLEATKLVANILAQGEMNGFRILTGREVAELKSDVLSKADVVWRADGVVGTLRVIPKSIKVTAKDIANHVVADDLKACNGQSASGSINDEKSPSVVRMFIGCKTALESWETRYTVIPVDGGGHYLFATAAKTAPGSSNEAGKADVLLRQAVYEVMKK